MNTGDANMGGASAAGAAYCNSPLHLNSLNAPSNGNNRKRQIWNENRSHGDHDDRIMIEVFGNIDVFWLEKLVP